MNGTTLFIVIAATVIVVFFPRIGVVPWIRSALRTRNRRLQEDALKHLLERRNEGLTTRGVTLAGLLGISARRRVRLQTGLGNAGLIRTQGEDLKLTEKGEELALHMLRAHRLWEHFLANEAHLPLTKIHRAAHRREHRSDVEEIHTMEARLGYPGADPHGDPIPRRDGTIADAAKGLPVTSWEEDRPGVVVHLEDEPEVVFRQILAEGIELGQRIRIISSDSQRIVLTDGEREFRLAPVVAANVFVAEPPKSAGPGGVGLSSVPDGNEVEVVGISDTCQGYTRRRLLDLGLIPGTRVVPELSNSFGDPRAYRIRGTLIALRREQASHVIARPVADDGGHGSTPDPEEIDGASARNATERSTYEQPV